MVPFILVAMWSTQRCVSWLPVAESVEEAAEDPALPAEGRTRRGCDGPLARDGLVVVGASDGVDGLRLVEVLGAADLRNEADECAIAHDLGFEARGTVGIPLSVAAAGQGDAHAELADAAAEKVCVNATVPKGIDHSAGPEFVHAREASARF